jgi:AraC family transcriptional regulator
MRYLEVATRADSADGVRLVQVLDAAPCEDVTETLRAPMLGVHLAPAQRLTQRRDGSRFERTFLPGQLTFIPAGMTAACSTKSRPSFLHVHFGPRFLATALPELPGSLPNRNWFEDPLVRDLAKSMFAEQASTGAASRLYVESAASVLWQRLLEQGEHAPEQGLSPRALSTALELLHAGVAESPGVAELAQATGLSERHFSRMFKRSTGKAPHRYLLELRIERAKPLLALPAVRILDVALQVGFANPSHFAAAFRRVTGVTPQSYRASIARPNPGSATSSPGAGRSRR